MLKFRYLRWLVPGLMLLLAACGRAAADMPALDEESPAAVNIDAPAPAPPVQAAAVTAEKPAVPTLQPAAPTDPPTQEPTATAVVPTTAPVTAEPVVAVELTPTSQPEAAMVQPPSPEQLQLLASLPAKSAAPELFNEVWLNSQPLKLADLTGKVVIVDFWTFG